MIQPYTDIKTAEDIADFDVSDAFREDILPLAIALHKACNDQGIPYIFAATLSLTMDASAGDTEPQGIIYGMNGNVSPIRDMTLYTALLAMSGKTVAEMAYTVTDYLSRDNRAFPMIIHALEKNGVLLRGTDSQSSDLPLVH